MNEIISSADIVYFTLIAGRSSKDELLTAIMEAKGRLINIFYGKSSVKSRLLLDVLGFVPEENKVLITCLMRRENADRLLSVLKEEFDFKKPNTGIAFIIPIDKLSF